MNRTETLAELKRLRDTGGTVGPFLLRDAIAALEDAERLSDTISDDDLQRLRNRCEWYNSCEPTMPVKVESSVLLSILARLDTAERRVAELEREVGRLRNFETMLGRLLRKPNSDDLQAKACSLLQRLGTKNGILREGEP